VAPRTVQNCVDAIAATHPRVVTMSNRIANASYRGRREARRAAKTRNLPVISAKLAVRHLERGRLAWQYGDGLVKRLRHSSLVLLVPPLGREHDMRNRDSK
jgi:hypothetical protein